MAPALKTLPKNAPRLDGEVLARCWLAAGAAGTRVIAEKRLDRSLVLAHYNDTDGRPAGLACIGVSPDLVVVASLPYHQASVGPAGLWDLMLSEQPAWCVGVDDNAGGAVLMRRIKRRGELLSAKGGKVWCTVMPQSVQPEGTLGDVGALHVIHIAADGMTEGELVPQATYSPMDWTAALPADDQPIPTPTPLLRENPHTFARLGRVAQHLPPDVDDIGWEVYALANGRTVRYVRINDDGSTLEISEAIGLTPAGFPTIFDVQAKPGAQATDEPLPDPTDADAEWEASAKA